MKRIPSTAIGLAIALVTFFQYRLILASLVSAVTWFLLAIRHPFTMTSVWNPALLEYWIGGAAWILAAIWIGRRMFPAKQNRNDALPRTATQMISNRRWPITILSLVSFVALTSSFLAPVHPNAQGDLVTIRLLPPLSVGQIVEYFDEEKYLPNANGIVERLYSLSNGYLLNRTVIMTNGPHRERTTNGNREGALIRSYPMVFLFGTDDNARDVFSRILAGTKVSLGIGVGAALGAFVFGALIGICAGLSHGILGDILMRLTDLFLAIPSLILVLGVLAFVGQSPFVIVVVLSLSGWMGIARMIRGEVVALRDREFILAARLLGVTTWRIITRHLIPNLRPLIITAIVLQFANAILAEAALGFLGLGIQPPTPTWGNMMGEATGYLGSAWWVGVFPGVLLAAVIVSAQTIGEGSGIIGKYDNPGGQSEAR